MKSNNFINRKNSYFYSSLFFAVAFITVLTVKLIFAWNPPTAAQPNPAGQTLFSDSNNNIGIGTLSPGAKLEIFSTSSDSIFKLSRGPSSSTSTIFKIGTDSAFVIQNQSSNVLSIKNGNVGIGTTTPIVALDVNGTLKITKNSAQPYVCDASKNGAITIANLNTVCVCNGTEWVLASSGAMACKWNWSGSSATFNYTGGQQTWIVPAAVTSINVDVKGAKGSYYPGYNPGGKGGRVQATLSVTPGETLYIYVGGAGSSSSGGYNGGANGGTSGRWGGGGGGASDIRQSGTTLGNRTVVAGGGGGGAVCGGGGNGGSPGEDGESGGGQVYNGKQGLGGTQSAGGTGGAGSNAGSSGSSGNGGGGGNSSDASNSGAGGGGGYYGGGGGGASYGGVGYCAGGAGGGSSWTSGVSTIYTTGYQDDNGQIIITY